MTRTRLHVLRTLAALGTLCACATGFPAELPECGGSLAPVSVWPESFERRSHYERRSAKGSSAGYQLIVEKRGPQLVVVGLTPFGAKAFALQQTGDDLVIDRFLGPALAIEPRDVLLDLQTAGLLGEQETPRRVRIENRRCRYEALITPVELTIPQND